MGAVVVLVSASPPAGRGTSGAMTFQEAMELTGKTVDGLGVAVTAAGLAGRLAV